ncbi:MAG: DEAD/DEAH box helicase family protein, partial [Candidatus Thorarchaeota archaeon]
MEIAQPVIRNRGDELKYQLRYEELKQNLRIHKEENKLDFFQPFEHQQKAIDFINEGRKSVLLQGANRIGKTVGGSCVAGDMARARGEIIKKGIMPQKNGRMR